MYKTPKARRESQYRHHQKKGMFRWKIHETSQEMIADGLLRAYIELSIIMILYGHSTLTASSPFGLVRVSDNPDSEFIGYNKGRKFYSNKSFLSVSRNSTR